MAKAIIKELIIVLLLCLAIILLLGVLLYEYVPSNKIIPDKVSYTTPEEVREELSKSENVDSEQIILTYSVDAADLNNYEKINSYVPGKPNPFSDFSSSSEEEQENGDTQNGGTTNGNSGNSGNSSNSNSSNSSGSQYFPDTGTK